MALSIGILGCLTIELGGQRLGKTPRKARALLAYLAAQGGRAVSRERLADLLWPYQGTDQARHSLRNCLLELRKALGEGAEIHLGADFSSCRVQAADVDLDRFESLVRSQQLPDLKAAADLYRGEFLADFTVNSEPFRNGLPPNATARSIWYAAFCSGCRRSRMPWATTKRRSRRRADLSRSTSCRKSVTGR